MENFVVDLLVAGFVGIFIGTVNAGLPPGWIMMTGTAHSHSVSMPFSQMSICPEVIGPAMPAPGRQLAGNFLSDPIVNFEGLHIGELPSGDGAGIQHSYTNFGDYSQMSIDPSDDCPFWYAGTDYPATGTPNDWHTRIGSFRFGTATAGAKNPAIDRGRAPMFYKQGRPKCEGTIKRP